MSDIVTEDDNNGDYDPENTQSVTALYRIMSTLYCLSIAADFRKPVEVLYPNIATSYLSVIKHPMDLGTLLLECMRGFATAEYIRKGLRLVFSNSLRFNAGSPMMEAISQHLESFAGGLFEEATKLPFKEKEHNVSGFSRELVKKRRKRLKAVHKMPLKESEIRSVEHFFLSTQEIPPIELQVPLKRIMMMLQDYFIKISSSDIKDSMAPILTLDMLLLPLMEASKVSSFIYPENIPRENILPALAVLINIPIEAEECSLCSPTDISLIPGKSFSTSLPIQEYSSVVTQECPSHSLEISTALTNTIPYGSLLSEITEGSAIDENRGNGVPEIQTIYMTNSISPSCSIILDPKDSDCRERTSSFNRQNILPSITTHISPAMLSYIRALDEDLGPLLVSLEERLLRGTNYSSVWQRPLALMWAQPAKSPWWPAMVLAASEGKVIPPTPSPLAVGSANISRIPSIICKQLVKLKGKFYSNESKLSSQSQNQNQIPVIGSGLPNPSSAANSLSLIPEGYALVEFFGTHDFGWVRQDTMIPIIFDGTDSISPPGLSGKIGCGADGVINSKQTGKWLFGETTSYMTSKHRINYLKLLRQRSKASRDEILSNALTANFGIIPGSGPRSRSGSGSSPLTIPVFVPNSGRIGDPDPRLDHPVHVSSSGDRCTIPINGSQKDHPVHVSSTGDRCTIPINGSQNVVSSSEFDSDLGSGLELLSDQDFIDNVLENIGNKICTEKREIVEDLDFIGSGILGLHHDSVQEGEREIVRNIDISVESDMQIDEGVVVEKEMEGVMSAQSRGNEGNNETDSDYDNWGDGEDDDNFDAVVPSFLALEADVSLSRLQGGFCQVNSEESDSDSNSNVNSHLGQSACNKNMKSNKKDPTTETKKRRRGPTKPKLNLKIPTQKQPIIQKTSAQKKKVVPLRNSTNSNLNASGVDADAGVRAEAGDLSGLLVHGLFMSSVLVVDAYLTAKDAAIEKTFYFTRWIEMLHPVPGGPSLPERTRGGRKKPIGDGTGTVTGAGLVNNGTILNSDLTKLEGDIGGSLDVTVGNPAVSGNGIVIRSRNSFTDPMKMSDQGKRFNESSAQSIADRPTIKRKRRKRPAGEPSIDALCLHIKPGRKAGWAAIQAANAAAAAESLLYSGGEEMSDEDDAGGGNEKRCAAANISNNGSSSRSCIRNKLSDHNLSAANPPPSAAITGPFHILSGGCTCHTAGEGAIHTRHVDRKSSIFQREGKSRDVRKEILRNELLRLTDSLQRLQSLAVDRDREKAAERERLKAAVLSRGLRGSKGTEAVAGIAGGGEGRAVGSKLQAKKGITSIVTGQPRPSPQEFVKSRLSVPTAVLDMSHATASLSSNNASSSGSGSGSQSARRPPKVWMPTALHNLTAAAYTAPSSDADVETSSEMSDGEVEVEDGDIIDTGGDVRRVDAEGEGEGEGESERRSIHSDVGESMGDYEGLGDVETEDEAELRDGDETDDNIDNDDEEEDEDGMLAMTNHLQASDVETEDEPSCSEDETEYVHGVLQRGCARIGEGEGVGDDQYPDQYEDGSRGPLYDTEHTEEGDDDDDEEEEEDTELATSMEVCGEEDEETRGVTFSSGEGEDEEEEEEEEDESEY